MTTSDSALLATLRAEYEEAERKLLLGQQVYQQAQAAAAAADAEYFRAKEAADQCHAKILSLQTDRDEAAQQAVQASDTLAAVSRIRAALPALGRLWEQYPDLSPEEKFTAAGMTLADAGLADGDLDVLASIPRSGS
jgi:chromosome segregation ATPase